MIRKHSKNSKVPGGVQLNWSWFDHVWLDLHKPSCQENKHPNLLPMLLFSVLSLSIPLIKKMRNFYYKHIFGKPNYPETYFIPKKGFMWSSAVVSLQKTDFISHKIPKILRLGGRCLKKGKPWAMSVWRLLGSIYEERYDKKV